MLQTKEPPARTNGRAIGAKAAIYCRVSTDRQEREGASLDTQFEGCQRFGEGKGFIPVIHYLEAESGLDGDRPEYLKMLQDAKDHKFETLIVWRMDRLGRDTADYFSALKMFRRLGVNVYSATEPTDNPFVQGLFGLLGEEESRRISLRVIPGRQTRARQGKWGGPPPIGYDLKKSLDERGFDDGSILVPNQDANLVQEVFDRYASGRSSLRELTLYLASQDRKMSRQGLGGLLKNRTYLGKIIYGKQARSQFTSNAERFEAVGLHPPLVDEDTFMKVQERLSANQHRQRGGPHPKYLLSGLLRCGKCDSAMVPRRVIRSRGRGRAKYTTAPESTHTWIVTRSRCPGKS